MSARRALTGLFLSALAAGCASTGGGSSSSGANLPVVVGSPVPGAGAMSADSGVASDASGGASNVSAAGERKDGSADPGMPAQTATERRADLDEQLDASLESFDEKLRREQQRTASERDSQATTRADGAVVDATSNGDRDRDRDEIRRDRSGDLQSAGLPDAEAGAAAQSGTGSGASAKPIPSGVDDDIIARRLRRAAENETDPELKEKLWDEYRDYKANTQRSK